MKSQVKCISFFFFLQTDQIPVSADDAFRHESSKVRKYFHAKNLFLYPGTYGGVHFTRRARDDSWDPTLEAGAMCEMHTAV